MTDITIGPPFIISIDEAETLTPEQIERLTAHLDKMVLEVFSTPVHEPTASGDVWWMPRRSPCASCPRRIGMICGCVTA